MIDKLIGKRLKAIREEKGYSLEDVALMTGVSRPSLSNIERGITSTSINNLWKISKGLSIPISYFFSEKNSTYELVSLGDTTKIDSQDELINIFSTFTWRPSDNFETFYLELDSHADRLSQPHTSGVQEIIIVLEGELHLIIDNITLIVTPKHIVRFDADKIHHYKNNTNHLCKFISMMCYPAKGEL
ncbi:helix-turn-helix domain-containing protein [Enterococcus faecalis]|uniref:helix-turn-helix domain-containing protein n=1 Tax=Enterococcus TaxID=1350 RepID=UPI0019260A88|nr:MULTISPECIES: helix-turn-helix transcriptional regulator [Enterococcus]MBO1126879.1 helix-turn-helix domain-containing protein [Enterococcus faecalis]MDV2932595.1 helix-turn-helix domain-containing protein [Enterococcus faecalis]